MAGETLSVRLEPLLEQKRAGPETVRSAKLKFIEETVEDEDALRQPESSNLSSTSNSPRLIKFTIASMIRG